MADFAKKVKIDIISDLMWPWCWVGKRKLEKVITNSPNVEVEVNWKPYFLRPNHPREGVEKPPNTLDNPRVGQRMKQAGEAVGINFTGKCDR